MNTKLNFEELEKFALRPLAKKDLPYMREWMQDESVVKCFSRPFESYSNADISDFIRDSNKNERNKHFACVDNADEYLGTVSLKDINFERASAEFAIVFRKKTHGTKAAQFATLELLNKAFEDFGLSFVYLDVLKSNQKAINFYQKVGFEEVDFIDYLLLPEGIDRSDLRFFAVSRPA